MVSRGQLVDQMAVGYAPVCQGKPGLWPCFPIMPRFGLMGVVRSGAPRYGLMGMGATLRRYPVIPRYGFAGLGQDSTDTTSAGFLSGGGSLGEWMLLGFLGLIGVYAVYSTFHQTRQHITAAKVQGRLRRGRRAAALRAKAQTKAQKYEEKAKRLEASQGLFGIF